jgi:hypothetical protein
MADLANGRHPLFDMGQNLLISACGRPRLQLGYIGHALVLPVHGATLTDDMDDFVPRCRISPGYG